MKSLAEYVHDNNDIKVESALESLELVLVQSDGKPTMSNEDVKLAVILIKLSIEAQKAQLTNIANVVFEPKKTFMQRLLKK